MAPDCKSHSTSCLGFFTVCCKRWKSAIKSGNPVLAATDSNTDIGTIARDSGFGFCCESNDVKGFAKAVDDFINADREAMGENGWNFFKNNWSVENGYNIIMKHFE